jgi:hypothetical protein
MALDIVQVSPADILRTMVIMTMVAGEAVCQR